MRAQKGCVLHRLDSVGTLDSWKETVPLHHTGKGGYSRSEWSGQELYELLLLCQFCSGKCEDFKFKFKLSSHY